MAAAWWGGASLTLLTHSLKATGFKTFELQSGFQNMPFNFILRRYSMELLAPAPTPTPGIPGGILARNSG
jgi:hypothetical protein